MEMTTKFYEKRDTGDTKTLPLIGSNKSKNDITSTIKTRNQSKDFMTQQDRERLEKIGKI